MDLLTTARSPWGESIFTHISWSLFWAALVGGLLFLLGAIVGAYNMWMTVRAAPSVARPGTDVPLTAAHATAEA